MSENTVKCYASAVFRRSSESDCVEFGKVLISGTIEDCLFRFENLCMSLGTL